MDASLSLSDTVLPAFPLSKMNQALQRNVLTSCFAKETWSASSPCGSGLVDDAVSAAKLVELSSTPLVCSHRQQDIANVKS